MLRRVIGPKRNEITKKLRRVLHNEELYALYSLPNIELVKSRRQRGRACRTYGKEERRVFGPKRNEITKKLRRVLHNEELYALYSLPNIELVKSRRQRGRACRTYGKEERSIQGFGGET